MVPPPPFSQRPSSPACQVTPSAAKMRRKSAMNSARASEAPPLPRAPVYLMRHPPAFIRAILLGESALGKCGSLAAQTSAESIRLRSRARRTAMSPAAGSWRAMSSATEFSKKVESIPVAPTEPISSLSQRRTMPVLRGTAGRSIKALSPA